MKTHKEIQKIVDKIHIKPKTKTKQTKLKKKRSYGLRTSKGLASLLVLVIISGVALAGILGYYIRVETNVTIDELITFDDLPAEELIVNEDFNALPNNSYTFDHWINISDQAQNPVNVSFVWSGNYTGDGIEAGVYFAGQEIDYITLVPAVGSYLIQTRYDIDPMCSSGDYSCQFVVTYAT